MTKIQLIIISILMILVIVVTLFLNTNNYVPANEVSTFTQLHPYSKEGFNTVKSNDIDYMSYMNNTAIDSTEWDITPKNNNCYKIQGHGLVCNINNEDSSKKEVFSKSNGSPSCQSYGLSNSRGNLCLDDKQRSLYTTRGGNATGGNGDIGLNQTK